MSRDDGLLEGELLAAKAELEACRADAERYRWLRDVHSHHFFVTRHVGSPVIAKFYGQTLDAAIDAAREGS